MNTNTLNTVYQPLWLLYGLVPVAAGADKFLNLLVDWTMRPHRRRRVRTAAAAASLEQRALGYSGGSARQ